MAQISGLGLLRHLRAEPNQHVMHFKRGRLAAQGAGLAYWFNPLSAAVAQVPVEDCETTFLVKERSSDFQEVSAQLTVTYRVKDPEKAAKRVNFGISLLTGRWLEQPLDRIASVLSQRSVEPARAYVTQVPIVEAVQRGAEAVRAAVQEALTGDAELEAMGLQVVTVQVVQVAPSAEVEKALQTPTREAIQQKADEAVFARRALAVEKERAIKQNELATEIELAKRQEQLIEQQGRNSLLEIQRQADAERARIEAEIERKALAAEADAREAEVRAAGQAQAIRSLKEAEADGEGRRLAVWREAPPRVALGLAMTSFAEKVDHIQHLSLTPDLLGKAFERFLTDQAAS